MELSIKNDEQLIKMATIIQRTLNSEGSEGNDFGMTEDEKAQLLAEVKNFIPKNNDK
jgi:ribose 5-phosphate isomerase RpiB